jgi:hypothetical protein
VYLIEQEERDKDFLSVCERIKRSAGRRYVSIASVAKEAIIQPAQSFYLSVGEIGRLLRKNIHQLPVSRAKQDLWIELARRYQELRRQYPGESIDAIARRIEVQSAPRFYMTPKYAVRLYYKLLSERRREKRNEKDVYKLHIGE